MKLYHAVPHKLSEERLVPLTKNIALEADGRIARLTDYNDDNAPYVFASTDMAFSATYAVPRGVRFGNYRGHGDINLLFVDKESNVGDPSFEGGLYEFADTNFIPVVNKEGQSTEQMVSDRPVDLKTASFVPIANFNDLMRHSVQVYQVADDYSPHSFNEDTQGLNQDDFLKKIHSLLEEGKLRWLNEERSLNPVESLLPKTGKPHKKTGPSGDGPAFEI